MPDLFDNQEGESHWYSVIAAAPVPESQESANVAVVVGNGRVNHLRYLDHLPRLQGIAAADEINVYQAVLESVAERLRSGGIDSAILKGILEPQMKIREPRRLYHAPSDEVVQRLVDRYLAPPAQPAKSVNLEALINQSVSKLDQEIKLAKPKGVLVASNVKPRTLYEGKLERHVPFTVPLLARALRGLSRDVLIDSLVVDDEHHPAVVRAAAGRIGQAFYAYDAKLRSVIRDYAGREIRVVGVLQQSKSQDSHQTEALREFISDMWGHHATVIDGNESDVIAELRVHGEWILAEAA
jgi:hypothetical protein